MVLITISVTIFDLICFVYEKHFCKINLNRQTFQFRLRGSLLCPYKFLWALRKLSSGNKPLHGLKDCVFLFSIDFKYAPKVKGASLDICSFYIQKESETRPHPPLDQNSFFSLIIEVRVKFGSIPNYLFIRSKCITFIIQVLINYV